MTARRERILALVLGVVMVLALLGAGELVARRLAPARTGLPVAADTSPELAAFDRLHSRGIEVDPYRAYRLVPDQQLPSITVNRLGLRGFQPEVPKPADVLRVLCLGGSVVFGYGTSSDAAAPPAVLQQLLAAEVPPPWRVEVVNAGIGGYVSRQELLLLLELAPQLEPDVIVVVDGGNDLLSPMSNAGRIGLPWGYLRFEQAFAAFKRHEARPLTLLVDFVGASATWLVGHSRLFALIASLRGQPAPQLLLDPDGVARLYGRNLEAMALLARQAGAGLLVVLQPIFGVGDTKPDPRLALFESTKPGYTAYARRASQRMAATLDRLAGEPGLGLRWIDLSALFADRGDVFLDPVHYATDAQNAELAAAIAPAVAPLLAEAIERRKTATP